MSGSHKNIRLNAGFYVGQRVHFITICCAGRKPYFANAGRSTALVEILRRESEAHDFDIFAYCVMPDHFHMLAIGRLDTSDLLEFVAAFKRSTDYEFRTRVVRNGTNTPTERRTRKPRATVAATKALWQKKFYDHILRETDNFSAVAGYIWMNPVRAGLWNAPQEYPYSGSFVTDWKKEFVPAAQWVPCWKTTVSKS